MGYISTVQIGTINIKPFSVDLAILSAVIGGIFGFWDSFISVYFTLKGKEKA